MTLRGPYGDTFARCDSIGCKAGKIIPSNGSHVYDRQRLAEMGWTYHSLVGDLCPEHSREEQ